MSESGKCPFTGTSGSTTAVRGTSNRDWWPNQLNLGVLHGAPENVALIDYRPSSRSSISPP